MKTLPKKKIGEWKLPKECLACGAVESHKRRVVKTVKAIYGEEFTVEHHSWKCQECGAGELGPKEINEAVKAAVAAYQKKHGFLTALEIKEGRKKLGHSQAAFAKVAGIGSASIKRWEGGTVIQTAAYDKVLRRCIEDGRTEKNPAVIIRERLSKVGFTKSYFENYIAPKNWDDTFALIPDGLLRFAGLVMQRTGFALETLLDESRELRLATNVGTRYKKDSNIEKSKMAFTEAICSQFAKMIAGTMAETKKVDLPDPFELRKRLIAENLGKWIDFNQLINCCWDYGIPVIHLSNFPTGTSKPTAMAMMVESQPVIVICKNQTSVAWMIFYLAHEMGHIFHKHLVSGLTLIDIKVAPGEVEGKEESEANDFADKLLMDEIRFGWPRKKIRGTQLAKESIILGEKYHVAPGTVALSYAYQEKQYSVANNALKTIEKNEPNPIEEINRIASERINWKGIRDESREWFEQMTGLVSFK